MQCRVQKILTFPGKTTIMKRVITSIILLLTGSVILQSCYKDIISPGADPNGPPQQVSFSGDVMPILTKNCTTSGCHDAVPSHQPSMVGPTVYGNIVNGGYINTIAPYSSAIYTMIKGGAMPPSGSIKPSDLQKIIDWIRNGAPNN
jgi:hypothetical protein